MNSTDIQESATHTSSVKYTLKHIWVIDNFSHFYLESDDSAAPKHPSVFSTQFQCLQDKRIQFQIQLYPKGNKEENNDYISLFIHLTFNETKVPLRYKLSIISDRKKENLMESIFRLHTKSTNWGWQKFVKRTVLFDKTKGFLANDQLTILCEIKYYLDSVTKAPGDTSLLKLKLIDDSCLENLKSLSILTNDEMYGNLLKNGNHSDVVLVVRDGEEVKAHKAILSARSPVFNAMFDCDMKEKEEGRVAIEDMTIAVAKELLQFIYTGKAELLHEYAEELLPAADKYGIDILKQLCGQYLIGQVTTDNAARLLVLADAHSVDELKSDCVEFICNHLVAVMITEDCSLANQIVVKELRQLKLKEEKKENPKEEIHEKPETTK